MANTVNENRKMFSISKEFEEVKEILDKVPNASRFICEAIIEKFHKQNSPESSAENNLQTVLGNLLATNLITLLNNPSQLLAMALQPNTQTTSLVVSPDNNTPKTIIKSAPLSQDISKPSANPPQTIETITPDENKPIEPITLTPESMAETTTTILSEENTEKQKAQNSMRKKFGSW